MRAPPDADTMIRRSALLRRPLDRPGNRLADDCAHAAADEGILHHTRHHRTPHQLSLRVDNGILQAGIVLRLS